MDQTRVKQARPVGFRRYPRILEHRVSHYGKNVRNITKLIVGNTQRGNGYALDGSLLLMPDLPLQSVEVGE